MTTTNNAAGIIYIICGLFMLSCMDAIMKWMTADYSVGLIVASRGLFSLIPLFFYLYIAKKDLSEIKAKDFKVVYLRAFFGIIAFSSMVYSFSLIPLPNAVAISFSIPLFITILAKPMLGEDISTHKWVALLLGFFGMLLIVKPDENILQSGAIFTIIGSFFFALVRIIARKVSHNETTLCLTYSSNIAWIIAGALSFFFIWTPPTSLFDIGLLLTIGILGGIAELLLTHASRIADASIIAPFHYTLLIWAMIFGYLLWGDKPDTFMISGAAIVIFCGLYIARIGTRKTLLQKN